MTTAMRTIRWWIIGLVALAALGTLLAFPVSADNACPGGSISNQIVEDNVVAAVGADCTIEDDSLVTGNVDTTPDVNNVGGTLTVDDSTVNGNLASHGGDIFVQNGTVRTHNKDEERVP